MIEARGDIVEFPAPVGLIREKEAARAYHDRRYVFLARDELERLAEMFFWAGDWAAAFSDDEKAEALLRLIYDADNRDWQVGSE